MMTTDKAYDKFYKLLNQIETEIFLRVNSMNYIKIWNLKLNRKSNKRMQICTSINR